MYKKFTSSTLPNGRRGTALIWDVPLPINIRYTCIM